MNFSAHPRFVEAHRRIDGSRPRRRQPAPDHLVDLVAVQRDRKRLAESQLLKQLAHHRIAVVEVGPDRQHHVAAPVVPQVGAVVAAFLVLLVEREVVHGGELQRVVQIAGDDLGGDRLQVLVQQAILGVDVGELVAGRVDLPVVGVARKELVAQHVHLDHGPRVDGRDGRVHALLHVHRPLAQEQLRPALVPLGLGQIGRLGVVLDVKLRQEVGRQKRHLVVAACLGAEHIEHARIGLTERHPHRVAYAPPSLHNATAPERRRHCWQLHPASCLTRKSTRNEAVAASKDPHERGGGKGG